MVLVLHQKAGEHVLSTKLGRLARVAHRTVRWAGPDSPVSPDSPVARTRQSGVVESERKLTICAGSSGISTCRRVQTSPYIYMKGHNRLRSSNRHTTNLIYYSASLNPNPNFSSFPNPFSDFLFYFLQFPVPFSIILALLLP